MLKNFSNITNKNYIKRLLTDSNINLNPNSEASKFANIFQKHFSAAIISENSSNKINNINNYNYEQPKNNYTSTIYENASHCFQYKEKYFARMEKQKFLKKEEINELRNSNNFSNLLFVFKYYTERRTDLLRYIREFHNFYNILDDKILVLLLKKIFEDIQNLKFEELDKVCLIVQKKGIRDFEVLSHFKKFIIILPHNFTYANIGNLLLQVDIMGILTNDSYLRKFYSDFLISGLVRLNYNDIIFSFDGLSKIKNVDAYVWAVGQYFILKKFNKLYRINSLRRLVSALNDAQVKDTAFWKIVDQYLYYNSEKIPQINIILEVICFLNSNLGHNSLGERIFVKFFNILTIRKNIRDFKLIVISFQFLKDNTEKIQDAAINNTNNNNLKNMNAKSKVARSPNIIVSNKTQFFDKIKTTFKICLETQLDQMDIDTISFLFDKEKNLLKDFNSSNINDKYFALFIAKIDSYSKDWQFEFYFEMGKYDSRFKKYAETLKIDNNSKVINSQVNEFNFLLMIKYIKRYEHTQEPNAKFFLENLIKNFNDILNEDLDIKYFELLISLIPYFPNILKYLSVDLKKKKLNKIIDGFIEYKNHVFIGRRVLKKEKKREKENKKISENKFDFNNFIGEDTEIDYNKLVVLKILNSLNDKKLNLQPDLLIIMRNSELIKIDIAKCYLINVVCLIYNLSLEDLEKIYNMKFYDSVYDKYVN